MKKRGLSNVVTTVLIILLVLTATAVVWSFLLPSFEGTGENIEDQSACLGISVEPKGCSVNGGNVDVILQAKGDGVDGVIAVVDFDDGSSLSSRDENAISAYASRTVSVSNPGGLTPVSAQAAVLVQSESGDLVTCPVGVKEIACDSGSAPVASDLTVFVTSTNTHDGNLGGFLERTLFARVWPMRLDRL